MKTVKELILERLGVLVKQSPERFTITLEKRGEFEDIVFHETIGHGVNDNPIEELTTFKETTGHLYTLNGKTIRTLEDVDEAIMYSIMF